MHRNIIVMSFVLTVIIPLKALGKAIPDEIPRQISRPTEKILVLFSYNDSQTAQQIIAEGLDTARKIAGLPTDSYVYEYLDISPPRNPDQRHLLRQLLISKYKNIRFDLIITVFDAALDFLIHEGDALSPDSPCLALYARERPRLTRAGKPVIQSPLFFDPAGTLELALKLFPQTRHILFVSGSRWRDREFEEKARVDFAPWQGRLSFEYTGDRSMDEVMRQVRRLRPGTLVIYALVSKDITGNNFKPRDVALSIAKASTVPVFCLATSHLDTGVVGGAMVCVKDLSAMLGRVLPSLMTETPQPLVPASHFVRPMLNWTQIEHWGVSKRKLPENSLFINHPQTLWRQYKTTVILAGVVGGVLILFIILLAVQNRRIAMAETSARKNASRFRYLFENMLDGFAVGKMVYEEGQPVDFIYIDANSAHDSLTGLSRVKGKRLTEVIPGIKESNPEMFDIFGRVALTGTPEKFEFYLKPLSAWMSVSVYSMKKGYVVVLFDNITKRKNAEESLYLFKYLVDLATDAIGISTPEGRHYYQNKAFDQLFGHIGDNPPETVYVDKAVGKEVFDTIMGGGHWEGEVRMYSKDGDILDVLVKAYAIRNEEGRIIGITGLNFDITAQKKAEDELKFRNTLLVTQQEASNDGILTLDPNEMILSFNRRFREIWDIPDEILESRSGERAMLSVLDKVADPEVFRENIDYIISHPYATAQDEVSFIDGRTVERYSAPVIDADGKHYGRIWYFHDITQRKKAEEEKMTLHEQLHQSQKLEYVGRLAGGVAHDFNNMLGVILGHLEMLMEEMDPDHPFYGELTEIKEAGDRSADLTRQLLAFASKQISSPRVLNVNETVGGMLKMLGRLIGEDVDLVWSPGEETGFVNIDPSQVDQLMVNLCVNARDAIDGVGKITIETAAVAFDSEDVQNHPDRTPGNYVMIAVSDTGSGMDKDTKDRIFEPFFTTKVMGKGTGLGLATVYGVVKQNNGFIDLVSEPGRGTVFRIYLPAESETAVPIEKESRSSIPVDSDKTILIVEDEESILKMIIRMLKTKGYTVLSATRPEEAIRIAETRGSDISLLITDVIMPGMNGRDLARTVMAHAPKLKCLFMSGYTADVISHHVVLEKGVNFIQKPFSPKTLCAKVRDILIET